MSNEFCECNKDGWCDKFNRDMSGRFREICRGINVDLGTAAAFREQWRKENTINQVPIRQDDKPILLLLKSDQAPGDVVCMTSAVYSLHKAYPGKYLTSVESLYPEIFYNNPNVIPIEELSKLGNPINLQMHYPAIHSSNSRGIHFMQAWCEHLGAALNIKVPLLTNRPKLYFEENKSTISKYDMPELPYWIVCSGGKNDFTAKLWGYHNYHDVICKLRGKIKFVQVGEKVVDHPPLPYIDYRAGQTNLRQLFDLVRSARGVLCGVSLLMHVAAALEKPCIVIAGGREPVQWNSYPKQHYLHTVGSLPCTSTQGEVGQACWRSRVLPQEDSSPFNENTCERPIQLNYAGVPITTIPECMNKITLEEIVSLILRIN